MSSSDNRLMPGDVRSLYEQCSNSERVLSRDAIKTPLVRQLAFGGKVFDAFSNQSKAPRASKAELAARYTLLRDRIREAKSADERLRIFAQWAWAALDMDPKDSLGEKIAGRLSSGARRRVSRIPFNDLYYAQVVQAWLPYAERLLKDAKNREKKPGNLQHHLQTLGYDPVAVNVLINRPHELKSWRSPIEFICQWLATRGGVQMVKSRKDPDLAQTLRNAYSRMLGADARRLFEFGF